MIDYHCHTKLCCHATGTIQEYMNRARQQKLSGIGFSDHFPMEYMRPFFPSEATKNVPYTEYSMKFEEVPIYIQMIKTLRSRFQTRDFKIKMGFELDYTENRSCFDYSCQMLPRDIGIPQERSGNHRTNSL